MEKNINKPREIHRSSFCNPLKLFVGSDAIFTGISRDISQNSASMFISLEGDGTSLLKKENGKVDIEKAQKVFKNEIVLVSFEDKNFPEPIDLRVLRIEISWQKGYDLFIAGRFENINEFIAKDLEKICPTGEIVSKKESYLSKGLPVFKKVLEENNAHCLNLEYTNNYNHVLSTRDFISSLAERYEFSDEDTYQLKLISDEALMNAFLYGSTVKGRDKTKVEITISIYGLIVEITDFAGNIFDDTPYHTRKGLSLKQMGGLSLIDAYSDDWQIVTKNNFHSKLTFYKKNSSPIGTESNNET